MSHDTRPPSHDLTLVDSNFGPQHGRPMGKLRVDVVDDEILVSLPGTTYSVIYFKREKSPQLSARNIPMTDDLRTPLSLSDFLSRAWREANDKARELGWIV
jgi:hypothetical protein